MKRRMTLGVALVLLGGMAGCIDPETNGSTQGTTLYVYNAASGASVRLMAWDDLDTQLSKTTPAATRTFTHTLLDKVQDLAWGGLVFDPGGGRLYLISRGGDVVRVERIRSQSGTITSQQDIVSFQLGKSSDRLSGSHFEQAAFDSSTNTLYVMEQGDSESRVWAVSSPDQILEGSVAGFSTLKPPSGVDKDGVGVAAAQGQVYAYFGTGGTITTPGGDNLTGARLRKGNASGWFTTGGVLVGSNTTLASYGSLAVDGSLGRLYVSRHLASTGVSGSPILVYSTGSFSPGYNQAPDKVLGASTLNQIRLLATAYGRSWLVASTAMSDVGGSQVLAWGNPEQGGDPQVLNAGSGVQIRGLALDGNK